jgi:hypothetical protein
MHALILSSRSNTYSHSLSFFFFAASQVARGGCFATPSLLVELRGGENRSFYSACNRRELAVGFRTCAQFSDDDGDDVDRDGE